jgi:hypothetical protein
MRQKILKSLHLPLTLSVAILKPNAVEKASNLERSTPQTSDQGKA